jgi:hypothetical protein
MRTIVMGSRTVHATKALSDALAAAADLFGIVPSVVIGDDNIGVGRMAAAWAGENDIPLEIHQAEYVKHGEAARGIRNALMAANAEALIAIWHKGDAEYVDDMVSAAKQAGLETVVWPV